MNFAFVSPHFPHTYWNFCDRLRARGVNVLGVGDNPVEWLAPEVRGALAEYYYVHDLNNYDEVYRALAYFAYRYGKMDWIESNNEWWLATDARLREDFNVKTGPHPAQLASWQSKAAMKPLYAQAGVPSARQHTVPAGATGSDALWFAGEFAGSVGWPLFAKPEVGVGGAGTYKIESQEQLAEFIDSRPAEVPYVLEEYVSGNIVSYDAIVDAAGNIVFESCMEFPPSEAAVLEQQADFVYYVRPTVPDQLAERGRATCRAFGVRSRFVHLEFFRLTHDKPGLGQAGDYVGLEVNMRPAGGYSPDMMNFAHGTDVYALWADMVVYGAPQGEPQDTHNFCVYASRRDGRAYAHSHDEVCGRYGGALAMCERMPGALAGIMGNQMYTAVLPSEEEVAEFVAFVLERADGEGIPPEQRALLPAGMCGTL